MLYIEQFVVFLRAVVIHKVIISVVILYHQSPEHEVEMH
jgi:hypothetical protein